MRLCAISVDLDEIPNYFAIHGLEPDATRDAVHAVYDVALDRLEGFAKDARLQLTLFAIGSDLARRESAAAPRARARERSRDRQPLARPSLRSRAARTRARSRRRSRRGADAIERACGERPVGFRAPGYTITDEVFDVLREPGVAYDSSVFPCPAYYAAKSAAIGAIALRGRQPHRSSTRRRSSSRRRARTSSGDPTGRVGADEGSSSSRSR